MNTLSQDRIWRPDAGNFFKITDKTGQMKLLVQYALLAPNSHNTQPWKFEVDNYSVAIYPDFSRTLHYSDRTYREMFISLGCALANLLVAASNFGLSFVFEYLPEDEFGPVAVRVTFNKNKRNFSLSTLFPAITQRVTNRYLDRNKAIEANVLSGMAKLNDEKGINLHFISDRTVIRGAAKLMHRAIKDAFSSEIFREELAAWIRPNNTDRPDGMLMSGFGMPLLPSLLASTIIRNTPPFIEAATESRWVEEAPMFLVISSLDDTKSTWLKTGKIFEYMALQGQLLGISFAPMAGITEHPETNESLRELIKSNDKPIFFARMGYPRRGSPHTPRRNVSEILV